MKILPYRARTASGEVFDISFPLHAETGDPVRVSQLISVLLNAIDRDIAIAGPASNGDVLQALAMSMALRAEMIHADSAITGKLSLDLLRCALEATAGAKRQSPPIGHA